LKRKVKIMADRIFPSAEQDSLGSSKQINTIDWEKFAQTLNKRMAEEEEEEEGGEAEEGDNYPCPNCNKDPHTPNSDCKDHRQPTEEELKKSESSVNGGSSRTAAWEDLKNWLKKNRGDEDDDDSDDEKPKKKNKDDDKEDDDDSDDDKPKKKDKKEDKDDEDGPMKRKGKECSACAGKGCKACMPGKYASNKIVFTKPEDISAESLMKAKTAGDERLVRAILAAREDRNKVIEARLERLAHIETEKNQRLAQRREQRAAIVAQAEVNAKRLASAEATVAKQEGFKTVGALQNNEKQIIAQRLIDNGFPVEYVEATLNLNSESPVSEVETEIREVMSSSLNHRTKRTAIASLVKVAELSQEQLNRCIRFWVDELGYGDEQWVRDLFAKK
jgi:hypothetical protein